MIKEHIRCLTLVLPMGLQKPESLCYTKEATRIRYQIALGIGHQKTNNRNTSLGLCTAGLLDGGTGRLSSVLRAMTLINYAYIRKPWRKLGGGWGFLAGDHTFVLRGKVPRLHRLKP